MGQSTTESSEITASPIDIQMMDSTRARASSTKTNFLPWHGFGDCQNYWSSEPPSNFPVYIWFEFNDPVIPERISFRPRPAGTNLYNSKRQMPSKFHFIGSNDNNCNKYSRWSTLCHKSYGKSIKKDTEIRGCAVSKHDQTEQSFRCLGLKIHSVHGSEFASLCGIHIHGRA